jgi:hypothetical protein
MVKTMSSVQHPEFFLIDKKKIKYLKNPHLLGIFFLYLHYGNRYQNNRQIR